MDDNQEQATSESSSGDEQNGSDQKTLNDVSNGSMDSKTPDKRPPKKKRKTRAQRRKEKIVRERPAVPRELVLDNENLVKFYKLQSFLESQEEFEIFMAGLRTTLPASFRINAFDYDQAKILRHLVQKQFDEFSKSTLATAGEPEAKSETTSEVAQDNPHQYHQPQLSSDTVPTIERLPWYPKKLAWQMSVTRLDLKKSSILQNLHKFIMAETENGFFSRQESVSMIPPLVLDIRRGQNILDMCAAPGSKTAQLLEYLRMNIHGGDGEPASYKRATVQGDESLYNEGLVVANDVDNKRCYMLVHQSNRLNSPNCVIINEDASRLPDMDTIDKTGQVIKFKFDRILCDAPCTGDGTVRKNPDVWRKWSVANANNFHGLQSKILRRGCELLKENGLLVYSTCSMNPVEDEAVVASVLRIGQGSLVLEDVAHKLEGLKYRPGVTEWVVMNRDMDIIERPEDVKPELVSQIHKSLFPPSEEEIKSFNLHRCIRMLPHLQNTGAFFVAVIRKLKATLPHEEARLEATKIKQAEQGQDGVNNEPAAVVTIEKPLAVPPKQKRTRPYHGFKEQPFIFLDQDDADWKTIKEFYGFIDNFPVEQLCHRCASGNKRGIHLVSEQTRNFIIANQEIPERKEFVKVINGGMRLFMRAKTEACFRICQDGLSEVLPYIKSDLKVSIDKNDLVALLERKTVPFDQLSSADHFKDKLRVGSCVTMFKYQNDDVQSEPIEIPLVAWRGERSLALYVSNTYKVHLRALVHDKLPDQSS